jgi:hypothetical protein
MFIHLLLGSPSTSIKEINARQSLVEFLHARPHLRDDIVQALSDMEDASRIVQKFIMGRGDASDLSAIHSTILVWGSIKTRIELEKKMEKTERGIIAEDEWASLDVLMSRMSELRELRMRIGMALRPRIDGAEDEADVAAETSYGIPDNSAQAILQTKSKPAFAYSHSDWAIKPEYVPTSIYIYQCSSDTNCLDFPNDYRASTQPAIISCTTKRSSKETCKRPMVSLLEFWATEHHRGI